MLPSVLTHVPCYVLCGPCCAVFCVCPAVLSAHITTVSLQLTLRPTPNSSAGQLVSYQNMVYGKARLIFRVDVRTQALPMLLILFPCAYSQLGAVLVQDAAEERAEVAAAKTSTHTEGT